MSAVTNRERLNLPDSLKQQLLHFRSRVWSTQMLGAVSFSVSGVLIAFLVVYGLDRIWDTPAGLRLALFTATLVAWMAVPWAVYHWLWCHRRMDQLARLLRMRELAIGDQLLSVIELAENEHEQARSRSLCAAAIQQVADAARNRDLRLAAPRSGARFWTSTGAVACAIACALFFLSPEAAKSAWARMSAPWRDTPRYTFTMLERVPDHKVLAHGESSTIAVGLTESSRWEPPAARLEIVGLPPIDAQLNGRGYEFAIPPLTEIVVARLQVGDFSKRIELEPKLRPELVAAKAQVVLPDYLQLPQAVERDIRGGTLSAVQGSTARLEAKASRPLATAAIDERPVAVKDAGFESEAISIADPASRLQLTWRDKDGLTGREPFQLAVESVEDERPSVASQELPRQAVVLESEQLNFNALAADDYGVRRMGMSWRGIDTRLQTPAVGEKLISVGAPDRNSLESTATFSAKSLGIEAQPIELRLWVEDYLPDRERVYSPPHILYVLTAEEHAIWITDQLSKWHRASLDVRDREMLLHETNKRLRESSPEQLADEEMRKQLRAQSAAESSNGRKLSGLSKMGEQLLRQASRNSEIGVGHLERWAEMLQVLNDISANRMPNVSDLLGKASVETKLARAGTPGPAKPTGPTVGKQLGSASVPGKPPEKVVANKQAPLPSVQDSESSLQPPDTQAAESEGPKKKYSGSRLSLPKTTLAGPAKPGEPQPKEESPADDDESNMSKALYEQEALLAEFERIADEMNTILANLEGSTLVKRLKAASREQVQVAEKISERIESLFGKTNPGNEADKALLKTVAEVEAAGSQKVAFIMDDMQSYFERRRMNQFKLVLDDMRQSDVTAALRQIGDDVHKQQGMSIAQAEYWADTLDRWAEDLVDPACSGSCPGSKTSDALPPSVILEVLRILEGEVNLRESTRVAEQAKSGNSPEVHKQEAVRLSETQQDLGRRTGKVVATIRELPQGEERFSKEVALLSQVEQVMEEAVEILASSETGGPAIAVETEAIELLLQCKRINPKGGGGGGSSPGGGGTGTTQDSALALLGSGLNRNEKREQRDVTQATGETGRVLPEEFRAGLDQYFNLLEATSTK